MTCSLKEAALLPLVVHYHIFGKWIYCIRHIRYLFGFPMDSNDEHDSSILERIAVDISVLTSRKFQVFIKICIKHYHSKRMEVGAVVGAIGEQSIGEPRGESKKPKPSTGSDS